jgi:hypothetical protein
MKNKKLEAICFGVLIGVLVITIAFCVIITVLPTRRTTRAQRYDLGCLTQSNENPLTECKEK